MSVLPSSGQKNTKKCSFDLVATHTLHAYNAQQPMYVHNLPRCSRLRSVDGSRENLENEISLLQLSIY